MSSPFRPETPSKERTLWFYLDLWNVLLVLVGVALVFLIRPWGR